MAADSDWKVVFQDDFKRAQIGTDWTESPKSTIVNGRMHLDGLVNPIINQHFKPDVRLEFDAWALDGIPPCDISATMLVGPDITWGYLCGFGARWNHANHLMGPGVNFTDLHPSMLIEHGKKYHCIAQVEGKHISYTVNGHVLFDVKADDPIGGPGCDQIGLITWTGMDVDNVKVFERITPTPDSPKVIDSIPDGPIYRDGRTLKIRAGAETPALQSAIDTFNSGDIDGALKQFKAMGGTLPALLGQSYVLGDLAYVEKFKHPEFVKLSDDFTAAVKANPNDKVLADYALLAKWFARFEMRRNSMSTVSAIRLRTVGSKNNPFYYKSRFYQARYHYWDGMEGGNSAMRNEAVGWMQEMKDLWPENSVLRQYAGEKVLWGDNFIADTQRHPAWAAYLREAYARDIAIMQRFFIERQDDQGGLGGGYGDDCELMRTWMQISAISSASEPSRQGIQNLAQGIWDNELVDGFSKQMSDVEHSAEPSADMLPGMLFLRWGDPLWVERNMHTMKTLKETYMGIDKLGYPRFQAAIYGGGVIERTLMGGGDNGYNGRPMKHFIWSGWQGNNEAKDWFVRWGDGWRAITMSQIGDKMSGIAPPTIWYPSASISPPHNEYKWWDETKNYFNGAGMIEDVFLASYYFSHDKKFLEPVQAALDMGTQGPLPKNTKPGSKEAQIASCLPIVGNMQTEQSKTSLYRWLTGDTAYDEYIMRFAEPTQKFRVNGDLDTYMKSFQYAAEGLRNNLEIQTTEVLSTDRAALGSPLDIFGAYTGAVTGMRDAATPTFSVTYNTPSTDFAALVMTATTDRLRVWLYNFDDKPMPVGLKLWRLKPGSYTLNQGEQLPGEQKDVYRYAWGDPTTVTVIHRAEGPTVTVPSGKVWCVDLRLKKQIDVPATAPDMAIGNNDIVETTKGINVTVHNIGNADAKPFTVELQYNDGSIGWKTILEQTVTSLPCPKNFVPSTKTLTFDNLINSDNRFASSSKIKPYDIRTENYRIVIDPQDKQYEGCETNNILEKKPTVHSITIKF